MTERPLELITIPTLTDMHVHFREPGDMDKEDIATGTAAALAGGVTTVFDMVNTRPRTASIEVLELKGQRALGRAACDYGRHYGFQPEDDNIGSFKTASRLAFGLKSMLEISTGSDRRTEPAEFKPGWLEWHRVAGRYQPIILHSETETIEEALAIAAGGIGHPTHVAHISNKAELQVVIAAKEKGWSVTAEVTPHHLCLAAEDIDTQLLGWFGRMKPVLPSPSERAYLWDNIEYIDAVATDHAPHTKDEKERANRENPAGVVGDPGLPTSFGVPGVEATLPLLLQAVREGRMSFDQLNKMTNVRPRQILSLPSTSDSVVVDMRQYRFSESDVRSKCGWSPYIGKLVTGRVVQVVSHGRTVYNQGTYAAPSGQVLTPNREAA